jgi:hypothetical protein
MTSDSITTFLNGYVHSLAEETRTDKRGRRFGFDQIVLQLAQAEGLIPLRLAFHRGGRRGAPKPKKEAEHGVDLKFQTPDGQTLLVFVLKDEPLTYRNWEKEQFHTDLRRASEQDLTAPELRRVKEVRIILGYNKDEEEEGVEEFDRFVASRGKRIRSARLRFERWNLDELVRRVRQQLLNSPGLLPEQFFHSFSYLCWQVADFSHGSPQWNEVLVPDWKEFLKDVLKDPVNERAVRLVSIALLVLRSHGKAEPAFETGWIELVEWAIVALWRSTVRTRKNEKVVAAVLEIWIKLYLTSLELFYEKNSKLLNAEHSLAVGHFGSFSEVVGVYFTYWHIARLGILGLFFFELYNRAQAETAEAARKGFFKVLNWLVGLMNSNPASRRPVLDIHHIQLFLIWRMLRCAQRAPEALAIFTDIFQRLLYRRLGQGGQRLINQSNSWAHLLEFIATGEEPSEAYGRSSYLLQMIAEICARDFGADGHELLRRIYRHLIQGIDDNGNSFEFPERVELQSWAPPDRWAEKVLRGYVGHQGVCITVNTYYEESNPDLSDLADRVSSFVLQTRAAHPFKQTRGIPASVCILACLLHNSPLPPEFWRIGLYDTKDDAVGASTLDDRNRSSEEV